MTPVTETQAWDVALVREAVWYVVRASTLESDDVGFKCRL